MKFGFLILTLLSILLQANYTLEPSHREHSQIDNMPKNTIADMRNIPQNLSYYAKQIKPISMKKQLKLDRAYNKKFFSVWSMKKIDKSAYELSWPIRTVTKRVIYSANHKIIPKSIYSRWITNSNYKKLNSVSQYAITTRHCNLHAFPMGSRFYYDPKKAGEGFPFDYNQNSSYHINTPLYLSHYSLDRKWAFVRGATAYGWIHISSIAIVDREFVKRFKNGNYSIVLRDNIRLKYNKKSLSIIKIGSIFPTIKHNKKVGYLFATRSPKGRAELRVALASNPNLLAEKPIAFTSHNVAMIAEQLHNEPYGWGGILETRDCSSMTKDYLSVFGIFLRRNSSKQARDGKYINIKGYKKAKKKKRIISKAKPFRSLLFVNGHIVLYLGSYKGEPIIMHTYWGVRQNNGSKYILGRTVITTTEPAKELKSTKESSKLINTLKGIILFGE